jgi:hypothetical protein
MAIRLISLGVSLTTSISNPALRTVWNTSTPKLSGLGRAFRLSLQWIRLFEHSLQIVHQFWLSRNTSLKNRSHSATEGV